MAGTYQDLFARYLFDPNDEELCGEIYCPSANSHATILISSVVKQAMEEGMAYFSEKNYEASKERFTFAIENATDVFEAYTNRGAIYSILGQYDEAECDFLKSLEINSHNYSAYYNLAKVYMEKEKLEESYNFFQKARELNPQEALIYYNLGLLMIKSKKYIDAIYFFDLGMSYGLNDAKIYYHRGRAYYLSGSYRDAVTDFTHVMTLDPTDYEVFYLRGISYYKLEKKENACEDFVTWMNSTKRKDAESNPFFEVIKGKMNTFFCGDAEMLQMLNRALEISELDLISHKNEECGFTQSQNNAHSRASIQDDSPRKRLK